MTKLNWLEADREAGRRTLTHRRLDRSGRDKTPTHRLDTGQVRQKARLLHTGWTGQAETWLLHTGWTGQAEARLPRTGWTLDRSGRGKTPAHRLDRSGRDKDNCIPGLRGQEETGHLNMLDRIGWGKTLTQGLDRTDWPDTQKKGIFTGQHRTGWTGHTDAGHIHTGWTQAGR